MNTQKRITRLSYFNCNKHTIVLISIFIPCLIITGLLVKLSVYGDYYQKHGSQYCVPVNFFWGNNTSCKKFINEVVKEAIKKENFVISQKPEEIASIKNNTNTNIVKYDDIKKTIVDNYLAIIELIESLNEFILLLLLKIGGNTINRIFSNF